MPSNLMFIGPLLDAFLGRLNEFLEKLAEEAIGENISNKQAQAIAFVYNALKIYGDDIARLTENKYDDKAIVEMLEAIENIASKYEFPLDPDDWFDMAS